MSVGFSIDREGLTSNGVRDYESLRSPAPLVGGDLVIHTYSRFWEMIISPVVLHRCIAITFAIGCLSQDEVSSSLSSKATQQLATPHVDAMLTAIGGKIPAKESSLSLQLPGKDDEQDEEEVEGGLEEEEEEEDWRTRDHSPGHCAMTG